jgi:hypothetical protein
MRFVETGLRACLTQPMPCIEAFGYVYTLCNEMAWFHSAIKQEKKMSPLWFVSSLVILYSIRLHKKSETSVISI